MGGEEKRTGNPSLFDCYMEILIPSGLPLTLPYASHPLFLPSRPWE